MDFYTSQSTPGSDEKIIKTLSKKGDYIDDWGSVWRIAEPGVIGEVIKPVLYSRFSLKKFKLSFIVSEYRRTMKEIYHRIILLGLILSIIIS